MRTAFLEGWKQNGIDSGQFIQLLICLCEDDIHVHDVHMLENFTNVLRLKQVVMGKEKLVNNIYSGDQ